MRPDDLTQAEVNLIACDVREQTAEPKDARRLLEHFCNLYDLWGEDKFKADQLRQFERLLEHLRDSLGNHLKDKTKSLESVFGLVRKKGRPKADQEHLLKMALELLKLRLIKKLSHEKARLRISEKNYCSIDVVDRAWKNDQQFALELLRDERPDTCPWTPDETKRLIKMFKEKSWFKS
jgi:hypothetical protein